MSHDPTVLPPGLPVPVDDGACAGLPGTAMPPVALAASGGGTVRVDRTPEGADRLVIYAYPRTARPGEDPLVPDWDLIPGARGCTPEACGFRDNAAGLRAAGAAVIGLSTQDTAYQREAAERLHLPFPLVSDAGHVLTDALGLPTLDVAGERLLRRFTLVVRDGVIEHCFYPVFPPDRHAEEVLAWLRATTR
ncbi:peroxiredoxin [Sphaerisporangium corydalis]|uniref:Peroxiredoxin n=1 Tax=Sphaerisporangium corydalis TaxID=1441875 RepID=A0ABV9E5V1_9ACTN|nr:peroxiredoxin [Sphaerisporangium corydalis]